MTVKDIAQRLSLTEAFSGENVDREVTGCYIGDLLSLVMSKAQQGDAWITVQGNINVPAVSTLTDCAMVIIAENMKLDEAALARAKMEEIPVYYSEKSAFEIACGIKECL
ncbi:MAG: hypothetical protein IJD91_09460 [Clostridia bacterium]|nr:hypothetical protein [Clostridia bacterium]